MNREKRHEMDTKEEIDSGKALSIDQVAERTALFLKFRLRSWWGVLVYVNTLFLDKWQCGSLTKIERTASEKLETISGT